MRFFKHVSLLVVALPLALAGYGPPPAGAKCLAGLRRCDDNTLRACLTDGRWMRMKECSNTAYCNAELNQGYGDCVPNIKGDTKHCSTVDAQQCGNNTVQVCGKDGYWKTLQECTKTATCFKTNYVTGKVECRPKFTGNNQCSVANVGRCTNNTLQTCGTDGYWKTTKECTKTALCSAHPSKKGGGDCYALVSSDEQCSVANIGRCNDNALQTCGAHGYWKTTKKCSKTALCSAQDTATGNGYCYALVPSDTQCSVADDNRCIDNAVQTCGDKGYWETSKKCTKTALCFAQANTADCQALVPEPGQCSIANVHRCSDDSGSGASTLEVCSDHGYWSKVKDCTKFEKCSLNGSGSSASGGLCAPVVDDPPKPYGNSTTHRCKAKKIETLTSNNHWVLQTACAENEACNDVCTTSGCKASCIKKSDLLPTDPCKPGTLQCDTDASSVLVCTKHRFWDIQTWCSEPEKCTTHADGKIHCMAPNATEPHAPKYSMPMVLPPNKVTHNPKRQQQCHPGDMACDTERRFWFTCGADGMWKDGVQCFGPGYCRTDNGVNLPLACGGFPTYDGKNDNCNDHCEGFDFLYCVGVSLSFLHLSLTLPSILFTPPKHAR
jgi:hypothetical protein